LRSYALVKNVISLICSIDSKYLLHIWTVGFSDETVYKNERNMIDFTVL